MNFKNKLIPIMLFAMAICLAIYYYIAFPSIVILGEGLSSDIHNVGHCLPVNPAFAFISFFIIFIILGALQNRICNPVQPKKVQPKKLTLVSNSINNKI